MDNKIDSIHVVTDIRHGHAVSHHACYLFQCERQPPQEPDSDEEEAIVPVVDDAPPSIVP